MPGFPEKDVDIRVEPRGVFITAKREEKSPDELGDHFAEEKKEIGKKVQGQARQLEQRRIERRRLPMKEADS